MKQNKRLRLYHTSLSAAHLSFAMNNNVNPHHSVEIPCQDVSGDTTRQRDCTTSTNLHAFGRVVLRNNNIEQGNKLGLPFCHRDLFYIQGSHMGIH